MTGKGIALFFWWLIYAFVVVLIYRFYKPPLAYVVYTALVMIVYSIGCAAIKQAK